MIYKFIKTIADSLTVGVDNQGFVKTQTNPVYSLYGPAYNVRSQLASTVGGAMLLNQQVVLVSVLGDGAYPSGTFNLTPLAEVNN